MEQKAYTRKTYRVGQSLMITLPKKWIDLCKVEEGNPLTMSINPDYSLRIVPESVYRPEEDSEELKIIFYPEVGKEVFEKCLSGVKRIIIISERPIDKDHLTQIKYFIKKLPFTKIISKKPQEIVILNLGVNDLPSDEILRSLFSKVFDLFKNIRENDLEEKEDNLKEFKEFYMLLTQYTRTYLTTGYRHQKDFKDFNAKKASDYREISNALRDISYLLYDMDFNKEGLEFFGKIEDFFRDTYDSFLFRSKDKKKAYLLYFKNLWDEGTLLKDSVEGKIKFMIKELLRIFHKCSDILSIISILD